jgi:HPt (histidine-containing phosphotransfer) domain-containing protein
MAALCGEDAGLIREMLGEFVSVSQVICQELAEAVDRRVASGVRHCAHNLKGSSRTAGARELAKIAWQLESMAEDANWAEVVPLAASIQRELERVAAQVKAL